uniref:Uncharacterized protein n=1 Tax=Panagrolaimus davidi TaxID=227884 RepID=A0A914PZK9_9BILA
MTTKNDSLFRKGKQKLSYNNGSHSGQKFSNINLKQSLIPVKSNSKTHNENFNDSVRSILSVAGKPRSSSPATCLLTGLERTAYSFSPTSNLSANDSRDSADEDEWLKSDSTQRSDDKMPAASKNEILSTNPAKNSSHRQKQHKAGRENCSGNENREPQQSKSSKVFKTWNIDQTKNGSDEVVKPGVSKDDVPSPATAIRRKELQYAKMDLEIAEIRNRASMKNLNTRVIDVYGKTVTETKIIVKEKKPKRSAKKEAKTRFDEEIPDSCTEDDSNN